MKHLHIAIILGLLMTHAGCVDNDEGPDIPYEVNVSGNVIRLSHLRLDSVKVILSTPFHRDSADENGVFNFSFACSEITEVSASIKFMRPSFYDTTFEIIYGPEKKNVVLSDVKMTSKDTIAYPTSPK